MKKIVLLTITIILLSACSEVTDTVNEEISNGKKDVAVADTTKPVLPLNGKTIILDPGHGGIDPGAVANDLEEKALNLTISLYTKELLEEQGAEVILTRETDDKIPFEDRVAFSEEHDADIFVSIHHNTNEYTDINGTQVYYNEVPYSGTVNPYPEESMELAESIQKKLTDGAGLNDMGVKEDLYYVLRMNTIPSVIVEVAFVTNPQDAARLKNDSDLQLFSQLISDGIFDYLTDSEPKRYASNEN